MDLGLKGKIAVITGAGRGLGRNIASNLAKEGARIVGISRTQKDLEELQTEIGNNHYTIACDLSKEEAPSKAIKEVISKVGNPDIIVNNVGGTLDINDPLCSIDEWRKIWQLNLGVAIEINNLVIPSMRKKKWGRIINISSISGKENHGPVPYCSVKAALNAYTRSMGRFLAPDGIIMVAIMPGAVYTEKGYWNIASKERPEHVDKYLKERMAIHRFGTLDEIGSVVTFFCSDKASFCVGSLVTVDGGQGRGF